MSELSQNFNNQVSVMKKLFLIIFLGLLIMPLAVAETAITYQGQLQDSEGPVTSEVDMMFYLFDNATDDGSLPLDEIPIGNVSVKEGLFQVELDFGPAAFAGGERYLEIEVNGEIMTPRQPITAVPVATHALNVSETIWQLEGDDAVYTGGNVGIGVQNPHETLQIVANESSYGIEVSSEDFTGIRATSNGVHYNAIHGRNQADTGWSWGVRGDTASSSENAFGVRGIASDSGGASKGVGGVTQGTSDGAAGVHGEASASAVAETFGVFGVTHAEADNAVSPEIIPAGVYGEATNDGVIDGVRGVSNSLRGRGVTGIAASSGFERDSFTGSAVGIMGVTDRSSDDAGLSDAGGVFGHATATSGTAYGVLGRNESPDGWGVLGLDTSGDGYGVFSSGNAMTNGDHEVTGDVDVGNEITFPDGSPQRTAGPIAKGSINLDGTIENAVNVATAHWHSGEERYRIKIENELYMFDEYVTVVTPTRNGTVRVTSNTDDLVVEIRDADTGEKMQSQFQFVTYALPSGAVTNANDADISSTEGGHSEDQSIPEHDGASAGTGASAVTKSSMSHSASKNRRAESWSSSQAEIGRLEQRLSEMERRHERVLAELEEKDRRLRKMNEKYADRSAKTSRLEERMGALEALLMDERQVAQREQ